ncbi:MAG: hypothetical protein ACOH2V_00425 [Candidatus Saccharimonadaceae bacterium]
MEKKYQDRPSRRERWKIYKAALVLLSLEDLFAVDGLCYALTHNEANKGVITAYGVNMALNFPEVFALKPEKSRSYSPPYWFSPYYHGERIEIIKIAIKQTRPIFSIGRLVDFLLNLKNKIK